MRQTDIPVIGVVGWANPATYLSEALRWALTGEQGAVSPFVSVSAMLGWTALALIAVRLFFRYETVTTE